MSDKLTRKEMRAPDAFQKAGGEVWTWLSERKKPIATVAVLVFVIMAGIAVASFVSGRGEAQASRELGNDLKAVSRPVEGTPGQADAKEAGIDNGPAFKSETEKDEAIVKAMTDFRAAHKSTHAAATAALPLAQALYRLGRYDDALSAYDDFLRIASPEDSLRPLALEGKGYCYEAKRQLDLAQATFEDLSRDSHTELLSGMGQYHSARVLIEEGKKDDAARRLSEIPVNSPNTAAARMAQERMALLASQGVAIPAPPKPFFGPDAG